MRLFLIQECHREYPIGSNIAHTVCREPMEEAVRQRALSEIQAVTHYTPAGSLNGN